MHPPAVLSMRHFAPISSHSQPIGPSFVALRLLLLLFWQLRPVRPTPDTQFNEVEIKEDSSSSAMEEDTAGDQLIFLQVAWRHGDRAPIITYPTDPNGEDKWPFGWGELTPLGVRQQMALGRLLRRRYILEPEHPLISGHYTPKEIHVRSTDVNRTLASAMANLVAMFPERSKWPSYWMPIPVHTVPEITDNIGNMLATCPRADQIQSAIRASPSFRNISKVNAEFFAMLTEHSGRSFNLTNIDELNDAIYIETLYNLAQPKWINNETIERIQNLTLKSNEFFFGIEQNTYSPELIRLRGGNLLRDIVDRMMLKLKCLNRSEHIERNADGEAVDDECTWISHLKYYAYSAHDTTLAALLCTFGNEERVVPGGLPHYTASIAVELWLSEANGPSVKVLYHSAFHQDYRPITDLISGCPKGKELCPLSVFRRRSLKFMPANIDKECRTLKKSSNENEWARRAQRWKHFD